MALTKQIVTDKIEVLEDGTLQVRTATRIVEDGVLLSETYHRECIAPGDPVAGKDGRIVDVAQAVHKPGVVTAYRASAQKRNAER